jgi:hypothetical protein
MGRTDANGEFVYEYKDLSERESTCCQQVGAQRLRDRGGRAGQRLEAALTKRVLITTSALAEEYGQ